MASYQTDLFLRFKGDRDYLHGTDVYEALIAAMRQHVPDLAGRVRYAFHRIARTALHAEISQGAGESDKPVVAEMVVGDQDKAMMARAHETGTPVAGRYPYDEDSIGEQCVVDGSRISIAGATPFKPIEVAVAMTKMLHNRLQPPARGKWMFARLDLDRPFEASDVDGMSITQARRLGDRLTLSEVARGERKIGSIYFSLVTPTDTAS